MRERFLTCTFLFTTLLIFSSCDTTKLEDALDNFAPVIALDPINTSGAVLITDATTGELINATITATFAGQNGQNVIDIYSDPLQQVSFDSGVLNFGLKNEVIPTPESPAQITLNLSATGYLAATRTISITQTGSSDFSVTMIREDNTPPGVEVVNQQAQTDDQTGATQEEVVVSVNSKNEQSQEESGASLGIQQGSIFLDESGTALSGSLDMQMVYYDASEPGAVDAVDPDLLENYGDSSVVLLGALDMSITDATGKSATQITGASAKGSNNSSIENYPYVVNFILNETRYSNAVQFIRLVYFDPRAATRVISWYSPEVIPLSGGRVQLEYILESDILRQVALVYFEEEPVDVSLNFNRNGNNGKLQVAVFDHGFIRAANLLPNQNALPFRNITKGRKTLSVGLDHLQGGRYLESFEVSGPNTFTFSLPAPPPNNIDATINVVLACANSEERVRVTDIPTATVLYRATNAPQGTSWRVARNLQWNYNQDTQSLTGGSCVVTDVLEGEEYDFKITYDNNEERTSLVIDGTTVEYTEVIEEDICR